MGDGDAVVEPALDRQREQAILEAHFVCVGEALIECEQRAALVVRRLPVDGRGYEQANGEDQWQPGEQQDS